jgi:mono/diheme cytochrome c family protein
MSHRGFTRGAPRALGLALASAWLGVAPAVRGAAEADADGARAAYLEHCASCHGELSSGGYASPLIPTTLARKDDAELVRAILEGLPSTQMPAFRELLDAEQAGALVELLREPLGEITWSMQDIAKSRVELPMEAPRIAPEIRRENLILVVERGTGSVSVLDGDSMRELDRFPVGRIHGGLKFDRAFRQVLAATRDGTLVAYDLGRGGLRAKVKVGVNTRNVAISPDGEFTAAANQLPPGLVLLDAALRPAKLLELPGQPSAVYHLPGRQRFAVALRDLPRLYTIRHPDLEVREVTLPEPFEDFAFVPGSSRLVASSRGGSRLHLYDFEEHRPLATLETRGLPHLFSACFFEKGGVQLAAFNHLGEARLSIVDMEAFRVVEEIPLRGSGYFARTHPGTPYLWIDTNSEAIQLVEKQTLALLERTLVPQPGKKAMHVEFTAEGDRALVSVWHDEGAVVIYNSTTLAEQGRLDYAMPVGKYNAGNKTRLLR